MKCLGEKKLFPRRSDWKYPPQVFLGVTKCFYLRGFGRFSCARALTGQARA